MLDKHDIARYNNLASKGKEVKKVNDFKISLKAARVNAGLKQTDAAAAVGVLRDTVARWERGDTHPKTNQLEALCALYQIPIERIKV